VKGKVPGHVSRKGRDSFREDEREKTAMSVKKREGGPPITRIKEVLQSQEKGEKGWCLGKKLL